MKRVTILGSTGSVGEQSLDLIAAHPDRYCVAALAAGYRVAEFADQVRRFRPERVSMASPEGAKALCQELGAGAPPVAVGASGLLDVATHPADLLISALVGATGLAPTLAAIEAGHDVALANKEVLVMAGALVLRAAQRCGVALLPVDSEHSAIFQVLAGQRRGDLARIILTASGGPFRGRDAAAIARATVDDALAHPTWDMGPKITIDSATLMNKGLEVIEARWLFDVGPEQIDVVVHPESIVHSLIELRDTSVLAQLGLPDMRVPIAVALAHPERLVLDLPRLDLASVGKLHFEAPDHDRFPCLGLAFAALRGDEAAPAVLNAANEVAVATFLSGKIRLPAIAATNTTVLEAHLRTGGGKVRDLGDVTEADSWARARAHEALGAVGGFS